MAETIVEKNGSYADLQSRESSVFDPPTYEISYASDKTLKWDPPQGSKDLAVALSYYFPMERDLKSKMRAATRKFLKAEAKKELAKSKPNEGKTRQEEDLVGECVLEKAQVFESTPSRLEMESPSSAPTSSNSSTGVSISKPLAPGQSEFMVDLQKDNFSRKPVAAPMEILRWNPASEQSNRRKKRPYGNAERAKVAANRGNACEEHRRMKSKCDPKTCSQNKQNKALMSKFTSQNPTGVAESPAMPTTRPLTPSKSNGRTHSSAEASFLISPQVLNGNISRAVVDHACTPVRSVNSAPVSGRSTFAAPPNLPFQPENGQCSPDVSSQFIGTSAGFDTFTGSSTLMATEPEKSNDWDVSYPIDYPWPGIENQSIFDEESLSLEDLFNLQEGWQQAMAAEATAFGNKTASEQPSTTRTKPDLVTIEGIPGAGSPNPSRASPHFSFGFGGGGGGGGGGYSPSSVGRRTYESFSSTTAHHQSSIYDSRCSASAYHRVFNDNNIYTRTNARSSRAISGYLSHQNESEEETSSSCCDEDEYGQERRAQHSGHKYQLSIRLKRGEE